MKRFSKICVSIMAIIMMAVACFSFAGCGGDIVKVELQVEVYKADGSLYDKDDTKLTVDFYRHLAPETVNAILGYIKEGYYNGAIFYLMDGKVMMGDLKMDESGKIVQQEIKPALKPEFENGGFSGSNLEVKEGNFALWRTWAAQDTYSTTKNLDTGRATWFSPSGTVAGYQDNFCVFAVMDMENTVNKTAWEYINTALNDNSETFTVYYTGEYVEDGQVNNGLQFHCEEEVASGDTVFVPTGEQLECYASYNIDVAKGIGNISGARIVSAKVL